MLFSNKNGEKGELGVHVSVLMDETIDGLNLKEGAIFVDGTINGAGHSYAIFEKFGGNVQIVGFDLDKGALRRAEARFEGKKAPTLISDSFRNMAEHIQKLSLVGKVDGILLDLGLSSDQLHSSLRGFSFQKDEPLLMTFEEDPEIEKSAAHFLQSATEEKIADVIFTYGEETRSRKIARAIVERRKNSAITSSKILADLISEIFPRKGYEKIHPATKTFQALRIAVNDEIEGLKEGLRAGFSVLRNGGRMAVISFHSLEDREVKQFFKQKEAEGVGKIISKKPIVADEEERESNPRSRSAKLRVIEKVS